MQGDNRTMYQDVVGETQTCRTVKCRNIFIPEDYTEKTKGKGKGKGRKVKFVLEKRDLKTLLEDEKADMPGSAEGSRWVCIDIVAFGGGGSIIIIPWRWGLLFWFCCGWRRCPFLTFRIGSFVYYWVSVGKPCILFSSHDTFISCDVVASPIGWFVPFSICRLVRKLSVSVVLNVINRRCS